MKQIFTLISLSMILFGCQKDSPELDKSIIENCFKNGSDDWNNGDLANSFKNFDTLLTLFSNTPISHTNKGYEIEHLQTLLFVGDIYERLGNSKKAYDTYIEQYNSAKEYNNENQEIEALLSFSKLTVAKEDGLKIIEDALLKYQFSDRYFVNKIKLAFASMSAKQGKFEQSKSIIKNIGDDPIYENEDKALTKALIHRLLGEVYSLEGKYDSSFYHYKNFLKLDDQHALSRAEVYLLITEDYLTQKKYDKAALNLKNAELIINDKKDLRLKKQLYELYLKYHDATGNSISGLRTLSDLREIDIALNKENSQIIGYISNQLIYENLKSSKKLIEARIKYISGIGILSLLLFALFHFYKQSRNKNKILDLELTTQKLETYATNRYIDGQEEQNKRFAEILHDNVGANLSALNMFLSTLKNDVSEKKYNHLTKVLNQTIKETRSISHLLEPPTLKSGGLIGAIAEKAEDFCCDNFNIEVNYADEYVPLDEIASKALYNAILEFMNNAMKHAEATKMQIDFTLKANNVLAIKVVDNGKGFDTSNIPQSKGLGLNSIKSRIKHFGGSFAIQSSNKGTTINIKVPTKAALKKTA